MPLCTGISVQHSFGDKDTMGGTARSDGNANGAGAARAMAGIGGGVGCFVDGGVHVAALKENGKVRLPRWWRGGIGGRFWLGRGRYVAGEIQHIIARVGTGKVVGHTRNIGWVLSSALNLPAYVVPQSAVH